MQETEQTCSVLSFTAVLLVLHLTFFFFFKKGEVRTEQNTVLRR